MKSGTRQTYSRSFRLSLGIKSLNVGPCRFDGKAFLALAFLLKIVLEIRPNDYIDALFCCPVPDTCQSFFIVESRVLRVVGEVATDIRKQSSFPAPQIADSVIGTLSLAECVGHMTCLSVTVIKNQGQRMISAA